VILHSVEEITYTVSKITRRYYNSTAIVKTPFEISIIAALGIYAALYALQADTSIKNYREIP